MEPIAVSFAQEFEVRESDRICPGEGPEDAEVIVLTDRPTVTDLVSKRLLSDHAGRTLWSNFILGGLPRSRVRVEAICEGELPGQSWDYANPGVRQTWEIDAIRRLRNLPAAKLVIALGDLPLKLLTNQTSADKWHMSVVPATVPEIPPVLSLLHPERVFKEPVSAIWLRLGAERAREVSRLGFDAWRTHRELNIAETLEDVRRFAKILRHVRNVAVDIETGRGQITQIGFAWSPYEAVSIPTLPGDWSSPEEFHAVWSEVAKVLRSRSRKILQNGIYDLTYLNRYGISVSNFAHDTMIAQVLLNPELPKGLDTIAKLFTREPYWKDDAKDWGARQDRAALARYNALDCCVTYESAVAQTNELERRGLTKLFREYAMPFASGPALEMSWRGIAVDETERSRLKSEAETKAEGLTKALTESSTKLLGSELNPRSPVQVKNYLRALGFARLPIKAGKETSDVGSLMKLRQRRPDVPELSTLIEVSEVNKEISSYLGFAYDADGRMRYTFSAGGTETGRASCYKDPWNRGMNAQTVPSHLKTMFVAKHGHTLVEIDLKQADARVVAWDSGDPTLLDFYKSGRDIHRYVASRPEVFGKDEREISKDERQLGKKLGHASNYGVSPPTLADSCLKEMNLVISPQRAEEMLEGYHRAFPGIRRWQKRIRDEISRTRELRSPTGYVRQFNGRLDDAAFREAYAYKPQNIVVVTINRLALHLHGKFPILLQIHDSLLLEIATPRLDDLLRTVKDQDSWNPTYDLLGGSLRIPVEIKVGVSWGRMEEVFSG